MSEKDLKKISLNELDNALGEFFPHGKMSEKDLKLVAYAFFVCASSKEDPNNIKMIFEYVGDKIQMATINAKTKETKKEIVEF